MISYFVKLQHIKLSNSSYNSDSFEYSSIAYNNFIKAKITTLQAILLQEDKYTACF